MVKLNVKQMSKAQNPKFDIWVLDFGFWHWDFDKKKGEARIALPLTLNLRRSNST